MSYGPRVRFNSYVNRFPFLPAVLLTWWPTPFVIASLILTYPSLCFWHIVENTIQTNKTEDIYYVSNSYEIFQLQFSFWLLPADIMKINANKQKKWRSEPETLCLSYLKNLAASIISVGKDKCGYLVTITPELWNLIWDRRLLPRYIECPQRLENITNKQKKKATNRITKK